MYAIHLDDVLLLSLLIAGCALSARNVVRRTVDAWMPTVGVGLTLAVAGALVLLAAAGASHTLPTALGADRLARFVIDSSSAVDGALVFTGFAFVVGGLTTALSSLLLRGSVPAAQRKWFEVRPPRATRASRPSEPTEATL